MDLGATYYIYTVHVSAHFRQAIASQKSDVQLHRTLEEEEHKNEQQHRDREGDSTDLSEELDAAALGWVQPVHLLVADHEVQIEKPADAQANQTRRIIIRASVSTHVPVCTVLLYYILFESLLLSNTAQTETQTGPECQISDQEVYLYA